MSSVRRYCYRLPVFAISCLHGRWAVSEEKTRPMHFDVIIIGGGVVGSSLAYNLRKGNQLSVALLEEHSCGSKASGLSAGTIWNAGHGQTLEAQSAFPSLCAETVDIFKEIEANGFDCGYVECGSLTLACNPEEVAHVKLEHEDLIREGFQHSFYLNDTRSITTIEPALTGTRALAAHYLPRSAYIEPMKATAALAQAAVAKQAVIIEDMLVVRIDQSTNFIATHEDYQQQQQQQASRVTNGRYTITAKSTDALHPKQPGVEVVFTTDHVVVAAGVNCSSLLEPLGWFARIYPVKGIMWETNAIEAAIESGRDKIGATTILYAAESHVAWAKRYSRVNEESATSHATNTVPVVESGGCNRDSTSPSSTGTCTTNDDIGKDSFKFPMYCTHDESGLRQIRHCYGRMRDDNTLVFGGDRIFARPGIMKANSTAGTAATAGSAAVKSDSPSHSEEEESIESIFEQVKGLYPNVVKIGRTGGYWYGWMPFSYDGRPIVGRLGSSAGLWVAGGFGGEGMMLGPGATRFLADDIIKIVGKERDSQLRLKQIGDDIGTGSREILSDTVRAYMDPLRRYATERL